MLGLDAAALAAKNAAILVSFMGLDESFNATVHVRKFYTFEELRFGQRFVDILKDDGPSRLLDLTKVHETEPETAAVAPA